MTRDTVISLHKAGVSVKEISAKTGVSTGRILRMITTDNGIRTNGRHRKLKRKEVDRSAPHDEGWNICLDMIEQKIQDAYREGYEAGCLKSSQR